VRTGEEPAASGAKPEGEGGIGETVGGLPVRVGFDLDANAARATAISPGWYGSIDALGYRSAAGTFIIELPLMRDRMMVRVRW
jgi:hypothetical protein